MKALVRKYTASINYSYLKYLFSLHFSRSASSKYVADKKQDISKLRNIGIMAHVDAGKTTTTERMLYYAGKINSIGEVHHGNTITDYMEQERNRGITITSASVTFKWNNEVINLVDTPGHIDFTMEVEQALSVIDSAVIVLDGSAGVEAQTVTIWRQSNRLHLPRLVYINKCDRPDVNVKLCLDTLQKKLQAVPLLIHIPIIENGNFNGVLDLVKMEKLLWNNKSDKFTKLLINEVDDYYSRLKCERNNLVDKVSDLDDELADIILTKNTLDNISSTELQNAIRRVTLALKGTPILCGSSYKNIGVESLMDGICDYLPSPLDCLEHQIFQNFGTDLSARAFKVMHEKQRGAITFFRIYSGHIEKGQKIYNVNTNEQEQIGRVYVAFADDLDEVPSLGKGYYAAVTGIKNVFPGNLISSNVNAVKMAKKGIVNKFKVDNTEADNLLRLNIPVPDPVFFCNVETFSQAYQTHLDKALKELTREDPSLRVSLNSETGQTELAGMGELHLEIVKDRLKTVYNLDVDMGSIQIIYKEQLVDEVTEDFSLKLNVGSQPQSVYVKLSLKFGYKKNNLLLDMDIESGYNTATRYFNSLKLGISSAFQHGPLYSCQVIDLHVVIHFLEVGRGTADTIVTAAILQAVQKALKKSGTRLLEPIMSVILTTDTDYLQTVISEINLKRANIISVSRFDNFQEIQCEIPLVKLLGFAKILRTITSGTSNFAMKFLCYRQMTIQQQNNILKEAGIISH